jgi:hypothetical protein
MATVKTDRIVENVIGKKKQLIVKEALKQPATIVTRRDQSGK